MIGDIGICPKCKTEFEIVCAECDKKLRGTIQIATKQTYSQTYKRESEQTEGEEGESGEFFFRKVSKQNPILGGILNALAVLFIFAVLAPMCHMILWPKKDRKPTVRQPAERRQEVTVDQPAQKLWKMVIELPENGIYSATAGSGGSYTEPIHSFFSVDPPKGYSIGADRNHTTTRLDNGTVVPRSRIHFSSGRASIEVVTRKTFRGTIDDDLQVVLRNYRSAGVRIERTRFVTIDGVRGAEVLAREGNYQLILVKYKKHGLDHAITMRYHPPRKLSRSKGEFVSFLRSYRSLKPK